MIYLINPFITSSERYGKDIGDIGGHQMPLGIYYVAAYLFKLGEEVKVVDCEALGLTHEDLLVTLKKSDVKIIGLTSTTVSFHRAYALAEMIKQELPNVKIVIGGPHMTAMPEATMVTGVFDYGIVQEGEVAFSRLVKFIMHNEGELGDIPNLYYIEGDKISHNPPGEYIQDLDTLPFPARQLCPDISVYKPPLGAFRRRPVMNIVTSRGCPYNCIFCDNNTFGRKLRLFSADYVVQEIKELIQKFGVKEIAFLDDTFILDKKRVYRIFELLKHENLNFPWTCMTRVDNLDYNVLKFMAERGCWQIRIGIESGNQGILDFIKKGITLQQVRDVTDWCRKLKISVTGFFIIGHHVDTPKTIQETIEFALLLPLTDIVATFNTPIPGTESYDLTRSYGIYNEDDWASMSYIAAPVFVPKGLTAEVMLKKRSELYYRFYRRPRIILQYFKKIQSWKETCMYIHNALRGIKYIARGIPCKSISFLLILFYCASAFADESLDYKKVKCAIHIHTDISAGARPLESYVIEARENGIGAIIVTDEDWRRWEFGLPPFRRLIKKVVQKKSVMTFGVKKYLDLIKKMNEKYKDVIVIDGVQTNPFYYWSGNFLKGRLALSNRNKDMLVIGLGRPDYYRDMPSVVNHKSRFDTYHGDKFTEPYQDLIDYVVEREGLIFWSHPEYEENTIKDGVILITVPYQWDLVGTYNYTGFGIFWEGYNKIGKPKGLWDRILTEYCQGERKSPVWAVGELEEEGLGKDLGDVFNVVYVKALNRQQVLDALKKGRFYVVFRIEYNRVPLVLEEFKISDESGARTAIISEELSFSGDPVIRIRLSYEQPTDKDITVELIRNNEIIKEFSGKSQLAIEYKDEGLTENQKYYYRIDVKSDSGNTQLVSNPIFFRKTR